MRSRRTRRWTRPSPTCTELPIQGAFELRLRHLRTALQSALLGLVVQLIVRAADVGSVGVGAVGEGTDEVEALGLGVTEVAVGLGDPVGDIGVVVGAAAEGVGWSSLPIGLTGPPELWASENTCCERVVDDEAPRTMASATMLVTSRPMAAAAATAGAARDTRAR